MTAPRKVTPVDFETPGPASRKPSIGVRSFTEITNFPAESPPAGRSDTAPPGPIDAASFVGGGGAGGAVTVPTVNVRRICAACASQVTKYVPSVSVTVNVLSSTSGTLVSWSTPGPLRWKL